MNVQHIVWFKAKDGTSEEQLADLHSQIRGLIKVPGVIAVSSGKNFTDRANDFTEGAIITLESKEALAEYAIHPIHIPVVEQMRALTDVMALDFES